MSPCHLANRMWWYNLYEEPFIVLLPKDHKLCKKSAIERSDLDNENVLMMGEGHCFRDQVIEALPNINCDKSQPASVQTMTEGSSRRPSAIWLPPDWASPYCLKLLLSALKIGKITWKFALFRESRQPAPLHWHGGQAFPATRPSTPFANQSTTAANRNYP